MFECMDKTMQQLKNHFIEYEDKNILRSNFKQDSWFS